MSLEENEMSAILAEKTRKQEEIVDMTESNPTRADFRSLLGQSYDPDPQGTLPARQAVARHWRGTSVSLDPHDLFLTSSTSEAYACLFKLFCDPGDEILIPKPSYPLIEHIAYAEGCVPKKYDIVYAEGWFVDTASLARAVTEKTKALVVVHPNNPTGNYLGRSQMHALIDLAERQGLALISDEVFFEYPLSEGTFTSFLELGKPRCPLFVLGGLSKRVGRPHHKLSWAYARGELGEARSKLTWLLDLSLSVSAEAQSRLDETFLEGARAASEIHERIRTNHRALRDAVKPLLGVRVLENEGGWNAIVSLDARLSQETLAHRCLLEKNTRVYPGSLFELPLESSIVLSLLPHPEVFSQGLDRICDAIKSS